MCTGHKKLSCDCLWGGNLHYWQTKEGEKDDIFTVVFFHTFNVLHYKLLHPQNKNRIVYNYNYV